MFRVRAELQPLDASIANRTVFTLYTFTFMHCRQTRIPLPSVSFPLRFFSFRHFLSRSRLQPPTRQYLKLAIPRSKPFPKRMLCVVLLFFSFYKKFVLALYTRWCRSSRADPLATPVITHQDGNCYYLTDLGFNFASSYISIMNNCEMKCSNSEYLSFEAPSTM